MNPYSILNNFNKWWEWTHASIVHGLTPEEIRTNEAFANSGWKLLDGMIYGGWYLTDWDFYVSEEDLEDFKKRIGYEDQSPRSTKVKPVVPNN